MQDVGYFSNEIDGARYPVFVELPDIWPNMFCNIKFNFSNCRIFGLICSATSNSISKPDLKIQLSWEIIQKYFSSQMRNLI